MKLGQCATTLAVLEGLPPVQTTEPPSGFEDWVATKDKAEKALNTETDQARKAIVGSAVAIAAAALPIPVVGWIIAGISVLSGLLGWIGIRGKTQHMTQQEASDKTDEFINSTMVPVFNKLPTDARRKMLELVDSFGLYMYDEFNYWWDAVIRRQLQEWLARNPQFGTNPRMSIIRNLQIAGQQDDQEAWLRIMNGTIELYLETILHRSDAGTIQEQINPWFMDRFRDRVMKPLDQYMLAKYNATIDQYKAAGGTLDLGMTDAKTLVAIAGGSLVGLFLWATSKRKRGIG